MVKTEAGTAQGASVSPLLSNVYLHYVFDLWADQWRRRHARGDVILARFADDYVAGFEHREDAERFLADLRERFAEFGLELHPEKTRLIEFGRFAAETDASARATGSLRRSSSWASRISARRTGADGSSSSGSRARRRCAPSSKRSRPRCDDGCITRSPNKDAGSPASCKGTTTTTRCPTTARRCAPSDDGSSGTGERRSTPQPERPDHLGADATASPLDGYPNPASCTPGPTCASTPKPEGGAQCVRRARWDLCGGPPATAVPTAIGCV